MNFEEFLSPQEAESPKSVAADAVTAEEDDENAAVALDVQKAVVESLAADKAEQDETIDRLRKDNYRLQNEIAVLKAKLEEQQSALGKVGETLARNSEQAASNQVSLLDREIELPDRFPGETRDHLLEVLQEARDAAERDGRLRRAQILEAILVANEPSGELHKRREALKKLFSENGNIVSGLVMSELDRLSISYKHGEEYLLPAEILARTY